MGSLSKHFSWDEFRCPCCRGVAVDPSLVAGLEALREALKAPIIITSGYRCEHHNHQVRGASDSQHLQGRAADIIIHGVLPSSVYAAAERIPVFQKGGLGRYSRWTHVDVREDGPARW